MKFKTICKKIIKSICKLLFLSILKKGKIINKFYY